jgi:hypothetical protein
MWMDQAAKPTTARSTAYLGYLYTQLDFGNVDLPADLSEWWAKVTGRPIPGLGNTEYEYDSSTNTFYRDLMTYTIGPDGSVVWTAASRTPLVWPGNQYKMFAFCASSVFAAMGQVNNTVAPGVFSGGVNLKTELSGTTAFNALNTGHSAEFAHAFINIRPYWVKLVGDIQ